MLICFHIDIDQICDMMSCEQYRFIVERTRNSDYDKTTHWFLYSYYDLSGLSSKIIILIVYAWILIMILLFAVNHPTYFIFSFQAKKKEFLNISRNFFNYNKYAKIKSTFIFK